MGGRRLSPGQAVQALEEAIDVIRGIWDVGDREPLRVPGEFHHLNGAKRGPAPAHRIPIWIGAYRPRMQRLVRPQGRRLAALARPTGAGCVDRWEPGHRRGCRRGRPDPREIRRILNVSGEFATSNTATTSTSTSTLHGPSAHWVEVLGQLAVRDGIDTFVLFSDDPRTLEQFAEEVIPALREIARQR
jgi:alkanesulfonate monooxygenase SsuD/methylene tetrahydromethanopterin reductase-like flavin-dependent oxidoreductase (luciferase family)